MFSQKSEQKSAQEQMITNPDMMSNMMKQNLSGIVPQVLPASSFLDILPRDEAEPERHVSQVLHASSFLDVLPHIEAEPERHVSQGVLTPAGFSCAHALRAGLPSANANAALVHHLGMCMQIAMGAFVSYFFSGFILGKIPFPLSPSFRLMLQVPPRPPILPCSCALLNTLQGASV